jgi:rhodanese-related sulfurtransferase
MDKFASQVANTAAACMTPKASTAEIFIDVLRRADEFSAGHCDTATNLVWNSGACWIDGEDSTAGCAAFISGLNIPTAGGDYSKKIFVHCVSGNRAGQVAKFLQGRAWTNN